MTITDRILELMETHALGPSQLADVLGVPRSTLSHLLSGRNKPSLDIIMKIIENFKDVDLYWLLTGKEQAEFLLQRGVKSASTTNAVQMRMNFEEKQTSPSNEIKRQQPLVVDSRAQRRIFLLDTDGSYQEFITTEVSIKSKIDSQL